MFDAIIFIIYKSWKTRNFMQFNFMKIQIYKLKIQLVFFLMFCLNFIYMYIWFNLTFSGHLWSLLWMCELFICNKMYVNGPKIHLAWVWTKFFIWWVSGKLLNWFWSIIKGVINSVCIYFSYHKVFALIRTDFFCCGCNFTWSSRIHAEFI